MQSTCPRCLNTFVRFSSTQTLCGRCYLNKSPRKSSASRKPLKRSQKRIKQRGKVANKDRHFIDTVVRPYLDKNFGIACANCGAMPPKLDSGEFSRHAPDHIKGKGPHPELRYTVTNFQYLCIGCHEEKTGTVQWDVADRKERLAALDAAAKAVREAQA